VSSDDQASRLTEDFVSASLDLASELSETLSDVVSEDLEVDEADPAFPLEEAELVFPEGELVFEAALAVEAPLLLEVPEFALEAPLFPAFMFSGS